MESGAHESRLLTRYVVSVAGNRQMWAVGRGRQVKQAKEASAEMLIKTPGAL